MTIFVCLKSRKLLIHQSHFSFFFSKMASASATLFFIQTIILLVSTFFFTPESFSFTFHGFTQTDLNIDESTVINGGTAMLTDSTPNATGHAFFPAPIPMLNATNSFNFSTQFVFQINPSHSNGGGYGLAFTLSASRGFPGGGTGHLMGVFKDLNTSTSSSNRIIMIEFDTVKGIDEDIDSDGNHVGINLNGMDSTSYKATEIHLQKGSPIRAWIDYDATSKQINVTIVRVNEPKPEPLMFDIDLSDVLSENMYAGFSAATGGDKWSSHYILGWSFRLNGAADHLDASLLPTVVANSGSNSELRNALLAAISAVLIISVASLIGIVMYRRSSRFEDLEKWELDFPHRFRYRELHAATKGFRESEMIGRGGFGAVYKGVLASSGVEVAVKRITSNNPLQGMRGFAAEIESLGKLRHKNLVHLQGWCKRKNDLLLVYDYLPNGSLDSLLYNPHPSFPVVLSWEQRFGIVKGVASGLLYLHEDWDQVVIHRDVKSSNVLLDADMSPRLGDFGLARLYDHGKKSHTTHVVGTIGYIAPELTHTGKASTSTDVFAYGILLLEIACGRAAVSYEAHRNAILVDWVVECMQTGNVFDAVDARMEYVVEEMEMVLGLGLLCSHPRKEMRPTMRQVVRYLNGDEVMPLLESLSLEGSRRVDEITARLLQLGLVDRVLRYSSDSVNWGVSVGVMSSTTSFDGGR
ncbi:probable L-type lectin-domain containing receptor kinase VI.1 [Salvia splendens]|uniref:probable L-type lectin-domain containing receptor kinase VI.1 n=1 Tax=Salvia splendens TaxID=180675 RepID=UPI001C27E308|nr:probable L-type lectin-domain containing receptor kinase VI.1 [Salvia splendens]